MFPDSQTAENISLQRTKLSYFIVYGIAPFFHKNLLENFKKSDLVVVSFDEALNKVSKMGQMNINLTFWG